MSKAIQKDKEPSSWLLSHHQSKSNIHSDGIFKAKVIAFCSGKGGVGKTSMSLKIAKELASKSYKVLLVDCDYNLSNSLVKLGLPLNNYFEKYLKNEVELEDCLSKIGSLHLFSGCNGSLNLFDEEIDLNSFYVSLIHQLEHKYDYIILDSPAGMTKGLMSLNAYADERVFVVTPDRSSVTDSYSCIKILASKYGINNNLLLINNYSSKKQFDRIVEVLSETVESFLKGRVSILGGVKRSNSIGAKFDRELFEEENSSLQRDLTKVMDKLSEILEVGKTSSDLGQFFYGLKSNRALEQDVQESQN